MHLTFDSNCLIALERADEEASKPLRRLVELHHANRIRIYVPAIAASERKRSGQERWPPFELFRNRLVPIGLATAEILRPMCYWGVSYLDWCWSNTKEEYQTLERSIHSVLFANLAFAYEQYCLDRGIPYQPSVRDGHWLNAKCDVQALWCHIKNENDIFVTSDRDFLKTKREHLLALGAKAILTPEDALRQVAA